MTRAVSSHTQRVLLSFLVLCAIVSGVSCFYALFEAFHWPMVGDVTLIRYVVFLLQHGKVPYLEIKDINLPGSYLLEWLSLQACGSGPPGLRLYDGLLSLTAFLCIALLPGQGLMERTVGMTAGFLFVLLHLRDGIEQAGQRDYSMSVLVLLACLVLLRAGTISGLARLLCFQVCIGLTLLIKPTLILLAFAPAVFSRSILNGTRVRKSWATLACVVAVLSPWLVMLAWLAYKGGLSAFWEITHTIVVLHAQTARLSAKLLLKNISPTLRVLVAFGALLIMARKSIWTAERRLLVAAWGCCLVGYLAQGKGLPYQRYPLVAITLAIIAFEVPGAIHVGGSLRLVALSVSGLLAFWFAPQSAWIVHQFRPDTPFEDALALDLRRLTARQGTSVQCLDTFSGCVTVLERLQIVQSTGFLYDCYLFTPPSAIRERYRTAFENAIETAAPTVIVLTDQDCFHSGVQSAGFDKVDQFPRLSLFLNSNYRQRSEWRPDRPVRWWNREQYPASYRIYTRQ